MGKLGTRIPSHLGDENAPLSQNIYLGDDVNIMLGDNQDVHVRYDTADDRYRVIGKTAEFTDGVRSEGRSTLVDNLLAGVWLNCWDAHDSAPTAAQGRMALASPSWDPDGDGNGELVMYDGGAWQEVCDLPNFT